MDLGLTGKRALITGGSKGIGRAVAGGLVAEGARVAVVGRDAAALDATVALLGGPERVVALQADLSTLDGVTGAVRQAEARLGGIDILVNNAGAIRGGEFLSVPDSQWVEDWSLKLFGYVRMCRAVLPRMREQGGGRICNVVGAAARNPSAGYLAGGAANAALVNFTKGLADLGAPWNVLVTAVSPAATATERWDRLLEQQAKLAGRSVDDVRADAARAYPLGRIATPEDVADVVCFLVSGRAVFLAGITVTVDGGSTRGVYL